MKYFDDIILIICMLLFAAALFSMLPGCSPSTPLRAKAPRLAPYPPGTVAFRSNHHSQVLGWAAKYDSVIVFGEKTMFIIMPKTDQFTVKFYEDLSND